MTTPGLTTVELLMRGEEILAATDPELAELLDAELRTQNDTLAAVAHASLADPSVLVATGSVLGNVTAEGYPGARYHPGAEIFDSIERLAVRRACAVFGARYANVQPHSCSAANQVVLYSLLDTGDTVLSLGLDDGGHLTHGARASMTGRHFQVVHYGLDDAGFIDYAAAARLAATHRPKLVIAGASAYPRTIDYAAFRAIADDVGAFLLADISHVSGLVAAGLHPSPIDHAHVTTTSTYKQLGGPRGGLILSGRDHATLASRLDRGVFPRVQGTPNAAAIAGKARALHLAGTAEFRAWARLIVADAQALAGALAARGHRIMTGGTDNHMVLVDVDAAGLTGVVAEKALRECGILANRNRISGDTKPATVGSGLRFGTNILAQRGLTPAQVRRIGQLADRVLRSISTTGDTGYRLDPVVRAEVGAEVADICRRFPFPGYTAASKEEIS
ncbi:MAG TPA: serine hydroxymethyltransferase [Pseudonocardiaceae bacterium]|jgi:glycine hydroxymethyltransferase|nr:serine hydroxymethyltransferase [Pseudonocardiaceae bacterium]